MSNVIFVDDNESEQFHQIVRKNRPQLNAAARALGSNDVENQSAVAGATVTDALNALGGTEPGIQYLSVDPLPTVSEPVVLYHFPSLVDQGPNGVDLAVAVGPVGATELVPGSPAIIMGSNSRLESIASNIAALQIVGDLTIWALFVRDSAANDEFLIAYGGPGGAAQPDNRLYRLGMRQWSVIPRNLEWFQEEGASVNISLATTTASGIASPSLPAIHVPVLVAASRSVSGGQCTVTFYSGGNQFGPPVGPLNNANGGDGPNTKLVVGAGQPGSGGIVGAAMEINSLMLTAGASTLTDYRLMHNYCMGGVYGILPVP